LRLEVETEALEALLAEGVAELGDDPAAVPVAALARLSQLVAVWTRRVDLTGHRDAEQVARRLVLDALALCAAVPAFPSLADLGSGAGFPGLPIAIRHPERRVTLVESRERRSHFQRMAIRELGLVNAQALLGRAEHLEPSTHAAVVAQALGPPGQALPLMRRWCEPGGMLLLPAGAHPPTLDSSWRRVAYSVPLGGPERTLLIGRAPAA
jgi:16S rRNA (guanine527-N7)-methyltransferase